MQIFLFFVNQASTAEPRVLHDILWSCYYRPTFYIYKYIGCNTGTAFAIRLSDSVANAYSMWQIIGPGWGEGEVTVQRGG